MRRWTLSLFLLLSAATLVRAQQPFTIAASPRTRVVAADTVSFGVTISVAPGFSADITLGATVQGMPQARAFFTRNPLRFPYTDPVVLNVVMNGPKVGGSHAVILEAKNGPALARDTCMLVVQDHPAWRTFTSENSPIPNYIHALAVDRAGAGWLATSRGLMRYDGSAWTVFDKASSPFGDETITGVAVDSSNNVWAASKGMFARYGNGAWTQFPRPDKERPIRLAASADGTVWFTSQAGLGKFDGVAFTYYAPDAPLRGAKGGPLDMISVSAGGTVWIYNDSYFLKFDGMYWTTSTISSEFVFLSSYTDLKAMGDSVWFVNSAGTASSGVARQRGTDLALFRADFGAQNGFPDSFPGNHPRSIALDGRIMWVGGNDGLRRFDMADSSAMWHYRIGNSGLAANQVEFVTVGPDHDVWILTYRVGRSAPASTIDLTILDGAAPPATLLLAAPDEGATMRGVRLDLR